MGKDMAIQSVNESNRALGLCVTIGCTAPIYRGPKVLPVWDLCEKHAIETEYKNMLSWCYDDL